jgi:hypothetical protein
MAGAGGIQQGEKETNVQEDQVPVKAIHGKGDIRRETSDHCPAVGPLPEMANIKMIAGLHHRLMGRMIDATIP